MLVTPLLSLWHDLSGVLQVQALHRSGALTGTDVIRHSRELIGFFDSAFLITYSSTIHSVSTHHSRPIINTEINTESTPPSSSAGTQIIYSTKQITALRYRFNPLKHRTPRSTFGSFSRVHMYINKHNGCRST